jgi:HemY protein
MIRVVFYLIVVGLLAYGVTALADRTGDVVVIWHGLQIKTSVTVLAVAFIAAVTVLYFLIGLIRTALRSHIIVRRHLHHRRGARAYDAISHGLIAVGAGDSERAHKFSADANRIAPSEPLTLLLRAQSAQLAGDRDGAEAAFRAMASRPDTKALGLHGLFVEARRCNDGVSAQAYAEEAARAAPSLGWAGKAVLEFRCKTGDWAGALLLLEQNRRMLDKATYRRQRAVLLTARALALEDSDRGNAKVFALEANKLAPTLVPAAVLAGRLLAEEGQLRKASRILDSAWRAHPHPELAQAYAELRSGESARDRLKRIEALAKRAPDDVEGALAVARAAIDAQEFAAARNALAAYLQTPTRRVCVLMANLERAERNDEGLAREWMGRALNAAPDPEWTADGFVSRTWLAASPVTGRLDAFEWRVPLTGMMGAPVIEFEPSTAARIEKAATPTPEVTTPVASEIVPPRRRDETAHSAPETKLEPIIPLVHAPDDPGPETDGDGETQIDGENNGWRKMFG